MSTHHLHPSLVVAIAVLGVVTAGGGEALVAPAPKTVTFASEDGLEITADLYAPHPPTAPLIVLFHQASWSRGEYLEIAPRLNELGFNCLAVDLRSGGAVNGVTNQTHERARTSKKGIGYLDAYPDLVAALQHANAHHADGTLIVWGSSYSAALAFRLAAEHPELVDGVLAFAPGEYFQRDTSDAHYIAGFASRVKCPMFVTSAKDEHSDWIRIFAAVTSEKASYLPETAGKHGSSALWRERPDSDGYWQAVTAFLAARFPPAAR